ncbi:hypothetical protein Hanom_Chr05g00409801 [Helianthus anomalus]
MHVGVHFAVCWKTLRSLAAEDWAREFIPRGIGFLSYRIVYADLQGDTCRVSVVIRVSSSSARAGCGPGTTPPPPHPEVSFRMAGQARSMSLVEFAVHSGLYTEAKITTDLYTRVRLTQIQMADKPMLLGFGLGPRELQGVGYADS